MGIVKQLNTAILSTQTTTLESGKQLTTYWKDHTINQILNRTPESHVIKKQGL